MPIYGRIAHDGVARFVEVEADNLHLLDDFWGVRARTGETVPRSGAQLLAPVAPGKLIAIGLNYLDHVAEFNRTRPESPLMWLKSPQAIIGPGETVRLVHPDQRTDFEAELCVVIGRSCKNVSEEEALSFVLGYTASQDISDRVVQKSESQWARAKSFDTYAPIGPFIYTDIDPQHLTIECHVNGEVRQQSNTSQMLFSVAQLVSFLSRGITLLPGDAIMTGTPEGVGALHAGETIVTRIGDMEPLVNPVENA